MSDIKAKGSVTEHSVQSRIDSVALRPQFYLVRPDPSSAIVPLIPYDELPDMFRKLGLHGVPDILTTQHIQEWDMSRVHDLVPFRGSFDIENRDMTCLQHDKQSGGAVALLDDSHQRAPAGKKDDLGDSTDEHETERTSSVDRVSSEGKCEGHTNIDNEKEINLAMLKIASQNKWEKENDRSKTKGAMTAGVYGKKKYCTHWIRTGNCDYVQEGCRYEHVIPDRETMLSIGIRDIPRWHREELPRAPEGQGPKRGGNAPKITAKAWRKSDHKGEDGAGKRHIKGKSSVPEDQNMQYAAQAKSSRPASGQTFPSTDATQSLNIKESLDVGKGHLSGIMPLIGPVTVKEIDPSDRPHPYTVSIAANEARLLSFDEIRARSYPVEYPGAVSQGADQYAVGDRDHSQSYIQPLSRFATSGQGGLQTGPMPTHLGLYQNSPISEYHAASVRTPTAKYCSQNASSSRTPAFPNGIPSSASQSPNPVFQDDRSLASSQASPNVHLGSPFPMNQSVQQAHYNSAPSPLGSTKMDGIVPHDINHPGGTDLTFGAIGQGRPMYKGFAGGGKATPPLTSPPIYHKRRFIGPNEPTHSRAYEPEVAKHGRHAQKGPDGNANKVKSRGGDTYVRPTTYEEAAALANGYTIHRGHSDEDNLISLDQN